MTAINFKLVFNIMRMMSLITYKCCEKIFKNMHELKKQENMFY